MPYSRHVGYLCPGITLSRRVITGRHAALRSTRSHTFLHAHTEWRDTRILYWVRISNYLLGLMECRWTRLDISTSVAKEKNARLRPDLKSDTHTINSNKLICQETSFIYFTSPFLRIRTHEWRVPAVSKHSRAEIQDRFSLRFSNSLRHSFGALAGRGRCCRANCTSRAQYTGANRQSPFRRVRIRRANERKGNRETWWKETEGTNISCF